jgi:glycosyltransferase involved in cell wall biosynthesis
MTVLINRLLSLATWAVYVRKLRADCISGHDIIGIYTGWFSTWFMPKKKKPFLVYDSHEFEIGRNIDGKRGKVEGWLIAHAEKFLMKKCAFSIMVNDSIADEVQRIHKLKERPIVVRNIPKYWHIDEAVCQKQRSEFYKALHVHENTFIAMYHGGITVNRGIENFIKAIARTEDAVGVILGNGQDDYIRKLKDLAVSHHVADRILFHPAVPIDELWEYVGATDVGIIVVPIVFKSYYYGLGNKFFENIQSMTPIICNNTPEMANIIRKYDIGLTVDPPGDLAGLIKAMMTMRTDKELYARCKHNLIQAKKDLCWENESEILKKAYQKIR